MLTRNIRSELQKGKHGSFYPAHILLPVLAVLVFFLYYSCRRIGQETGAALFYETLSAAFPTGIAWMSALSVDFEEQNHFYCFLATENRCRSWYAKLGSLYLCGCVTIGIAVFLAQVILLKDSSFCNGMLFAMLFAATNLVYYPMHLFLNLRFGKTVSIFTALAGGVSGLLFLTGLGDGCWYWLPYAMNVRLSGYFSSLLYGDYDLPTRMLFASEIKTAAPFLLIWAVALFVIPAFWFRHWEGRTVLE